MNNATGNDWKRIAGGAIDVAHMSHEDEVNADMVAYLKRLFPAPSDQSNLREALPPMDVNAEDLKRAKEYCDKFMAGQGSSLVSMKAREFCRERQLSDLRESHRKLQSELAAATRKLALIVDGAVCSDSLGVTGSEFSMCRWCGGGSSPGKGDFSHNVGCLMDDDVLTAQVNAMWEQAEESLVDQLTDRAERAEAELAAATAQAALLREMAQASLRVTDCEGDCESKTCAHYRLGVLLAALTPQGAEKGGDG